MSTSIYRILFFTALAAGIFFTGHSLQAQSFVWAKGEGGIGNDAANAMAVDEDGNTYIAGNLAGSANFSGTVVQGAGLYDIVLVKYDPQGNLLWVKTAGGDENEQANALRYKDGYLYMSGYFTDTCFFPGVFLKSRGEADAYVAKYDKNGNFIWARAGGGTNYDNATTLDIDNDGNIYVGGTYETSAQFDTVQLNTTNLFSESFLVKYTNSGQLLWAKTTRGTSANVLTSLACDGKGHVYYTGFFSGSFKLNDATVNSATQSYDIFLLKTDTDGNVHWLKRAGSSLEDASNAVCIDNEGCPVIAGYFAGTAFFGSNSVTYQSYNDVFVAKYDTAGNNLWVRDGNGQELDVVFGLTADAQGNIFATGMFQDAVDFDGMVLTGTDRDVFAISYNPYGGLRWAVKGGGGNTDCGLSIALKPNGNIMLAGYYLYTCSFGNIAIDYADYNDQFVAEYAPPFVSSLADDEKTHAVPLALQPNPVARGNDVLLRPADPVVYEAALLDVTGRTLYYFTLQGQQLLPTRLLTAGLYRLLLKTNYTYYTLPVVVY